VLFDPGRHEPLLDAEWDASRAHDAIRVMVEDMQENFRSDIGWRAHPLDEVEEPRTGVKTLYLGAAGMLWAMWYLEREGAVELRIEPSALIGRFHDAYRGEPDTGEVVPSYFLGEVGVSWTAGKKAVTAMSASLRGVSTSVARRTSRAAGARLSNWDALS
jgi:hypothetical protein